MSGYLPLSLGNWPEASKFPKNFNLSPITSKILKSANIDIDSLLPFSYREFMLKINLNNTSKSETDEMYEEQMKRIQKKILILQQIWRNSKAKRSKSSRSQKISFSIKNSKILKKSYNQTNRSNSKSVNTLKKQKRSKSPLIFKAKQTKKNSAYFDYYNKQSEKNNRKKASYEEQSTQTRRQRTFNRSSRQQQHFKSSKSKKKLEKLKINSKQRLITQMNSMFDKWTDLDIKHKKQLQQHRYLNQREKKRLLKIHQIQKQALHTKITKLRTSISKHKKLHTNLR